MDGKDKAMEKSHLVVGPGDSSYFYGTHLNNGCVPRFTIVLSMPIDGDTLRVAMDGIMRRFPQYAVRIERDSDGRHYHLEENDRRLPIFHDEGDVVRTIGGEDTSGHLLMVSYYGNRIMFDFLHVLGDGTGFMMFIKAVVFRYLQLSGVAVENDGTILTVDQPYADEEGCNAYEKVMDAPASVPDWYKSGAEVFCPPCGGTGDDPSDTVVEIRIPFDVLHSRLRQYGSSPVTFIEPLFSHAIYDKYRDVIGDRCIVASVPVNLRPYFPTGTARYFIALAVLAHSKLFLQEPFEKMLATQRALLKEQTRPEFLAFMAQKRVRDGLAFNKADLTIEERIRIMETKIVESLKSYTYVISNMGSVEFPPTVAPYVEECLFMLPTSTLPFTIATLSLKGELVLTVTQRDEQTDICERFVSYMNRLGVPARITRVFKYHTMRFYPL